MDLSGTKKNDDNDRYWADEQLAKGKPLVGEIDDIVSSDTVKVSLVLPAFGAPAHAKVHVRQLSTHRHIDSLTRHVEGAGSLPPLRKGDVVLFDRAFVDGGDARVDRITGRTHDNMRGDVQVVIAMARASATSVSERGALQSLTIVDGTSAFLIRSADQMRRACDSVRSAWVPGGGYAGFVLRSAEGRTREYHVSKDTPLQALIEDLEAEGVFKEGGRMEAIPAWKMPVGRDQVVRDTDVRVHSTRKLGNVSKLFATEKSAYPGFKACALILCDEDEWAFGGKTGKVQRVVAGIQPLTAGFALDPWNIPAKTLPSKFVPMGVTPVYSPESVARIAAERAARRPPEERNPAPQAGASKTYGQRFGGRSSPRDQDGPDTPRSQGDPFAGLPGFG